MKDSTETLEQSRFSYAIGKIQSALAKRDWKILEDYLDGVQEQTSAVIVVKCGKHEDGKHIFEISTKTNDQMKCLCGRWEGVV